MYVNDLYSYALHLGFEDETCKDAIHDVFCRLCANKDDLHAVRNMRFYLLRALKNRLLDIYKQRKETTELPPEAEWQDIPFTIHITVEDKLIQSEEDEQNKTLLEEMLRPLTGRQREIIYLRYTQECDYEEIAQIMNITVHSCRKLFYKAITRMRGSV